MSFRRGETDRIREPRTAGVPTVYGYLVQVGANDFEPTADPGSATHVHVLDAEANEIVVAPLGTEPGGVRMFRIGSDSYAITGG